MQEQSRKGVIMLIKNGHLIDPSNALDRIADMKITDGIIRMIGQDLIPEEGEEIIEAEGCVISPGLIDTHVHFRDPGFTEKEDIFTGASAAITGGFTTVVMMANTRPAVSTPEVLKANLEKGAQTGIHVLQAATVTKDLKGNELTDMPALKAAGAAGFTDDGIPIMNEALLRDAMEICAELNMPISLHEEDPAFIASAGVNKGKVSEALGLGGAEALAEEVMTARDLAIAETAGAKVVIQHVSSGKSVQLIREAKKRGVDVHAEATPHHFTLTEEAVLKYGTNARTNPPLRTEKDRMEIIRGLMDGTIDLIATDHAPHTAEEKARPYAQAPSGIIGLETALPLAVTALYKGRYLSLAEIIEKMSINPAKLYGLDRPGIRAGAPAELVIFAPDEKFTVTAFRSKASNSPFTGWELYGKIKYTICGSNVWPTS